MDPENEDGFGWLRNLSASLGRAQGNALFPFLGDAIYSPQASAFTKSLGQAQTQGIADYATRNAGTSYAQMPGSPSMSYNPVSYTPTYNKPYDFMGTLPRSSATSGGRKSDVPQGGTPIFDQILPGWQGGKGAGAESPQTDSYMNLLKSLLEQANGGPSYGAALQSIRNERKGVNKRYKENQGDIKNMFGNLTTMRRGDIAGVSQLAQTGREQSAAQTSGYSQQMIDAENQRLAAANEARQALGLGDIAAAAAGGDVATEASTAQVADLGALSQIGRTASEVNQNITEQSINDEIERYSTEQDESLKELGRSRTSALSDISSREQQILMQQAQAQAAAQQASTQLQLQIAGLIGEYEAGKIEAGTPKDALGKFLYENGAQADPTLGENAAYVGSSFQNWILSESPVNPNTNKPYTPQEIPSVIAKFDPEIGARIRKDPRLNNLVTALYLSASGK